MHRPPSLRWRGSAKRGDLPGAGRVEQDDVVALAGGLEVAVGRLRR